MSKEDQGQVIPKGTEGGRDSPCTQHSSGTSWHRHNSTKAGLWQAIHASERCLRQAAQEKCNRQRQRTTNQDPGGTRQAKDRASGQFSQNKSRAFSCSCPYYVVYVAYNCI